MPITVTGKQIVQSAAALGRLLGQPMPIQGARDVARTIAAVDATLQDLAARMDASATEALPPGLSRDDHRAAIAAGLDAGTHSLPLRRIPIGLLGAAQMSPADMIALDWLLIDPTANEGIGDQDAPVAANAIDAQPAAPTLVGPPSHTIRRAALFVSGAEAFDVVGPDGKPVNAAGMPKAEAEALAARLSA